jgi:DNA-directed RNA polymerase specialized sigma24 family protein
MSQEDRIATLEAKLDVILRLLALQAIKEAQTVKEKAMLLSKAGISSREIAALCDTTPNTISVALSNAKKGGK